MPKPFLSIGIIFKNEIRCLDRCLSSLAPLREAIPCELVMADTGSDDGSHEIAEKYADILFDFPWINDFAAARNAVMERCCGRWYLSMDADEWLDGDIKELVKFLRDGRTNMAFITVRNYTTTEMDGNYLDSTVLRLLRMSTKVRFTGAIHERWAFSENTPAIALSKTILHHDGYVGLNDDRGKEKRARNMALLKKELELYPQDLRTVVECIESSRPDPEGIDYVRYGLRGIEERWPQWESYGAPIIRYAIFDADAKEMPELEEWIAEAEALFPNSFFTRIDVEAIAAKHSWQKEDYADCLCRSERYLAALEEYRSGRGYRDDLVCSTIALSVSDWEKNIRHILAESCIKEKKPGRALELLETLEQNTVRKIIFALHALQTGTDQDASLIALRLFERISQDEANSAELLVAFNQAASNAFSVQRQKEDQENGALRPAYTLYLPLTGKCAAGTAAAIMEAKTVQEIDGLLGKVEKWDDFPITVLGHALAQGAAFPLSGKQMSLAEMDALARRLAQLEDATPVQTAVDNAGHGSQQLAWAWRLVLAVVEATQWSDVEQGMALARCFVQVEKMFLETCYTSAMQEDEWGILLPPIHHFGLYCVRAFEALDSGDAAGYVRLLRSGLEACPQMKAMVEFLTEYTPQLRAVNSSGELLALAEKVRTMLSVYAPDDPAVAMLKQSPAYQKVAHLIEGPEVGVYGGLAQ